MIWWLWLFSSQIHQIWKRKFSLLTCFAHKTPALGSLIRKALKDNLKEVQRKSHFADDKANTFPAICLPSMRNPSRDSSQGKYGCSVIRLFIDTLFNWCLIDRGCLVKLWNSGVWWHQQADKVCEGGRQTLTHLLKERRDMFEAEDRVIPAFCVPSACDVNFVITNLSAKIRQPHQWTNTCSPNCFNCVDCVVLNTFFF